MQGNLLELSKTYPSAFDGDKVDYKALCLLLVLSRDHGMRSETGW